MFLIFKFKAYWFIYSSETIIFNIWLNWQNSVIKTAMSKTRITKIANEKIGEKIFYILITLNFVKLFDVKITKNL